MNTADKALSYINQRAVQAEFALGAGLYVTENAREVYDSYHPLPGLMIPYFDEYGRPLEFDRVRYFDPPLGGGVKKKPVRYQQRKGTPPEIYLP